MVRKKLCRLKSIKLVALMVGINKILVIACFLALHLGSPLMAQWKPEEWTLFEKKKTLFSNSIERKYINFNTIRTTKRYVYWYSVRVYDKPQSYANYKFLSRQSYERGDCELYKDAPIEIKLFKRNNLSGLILTQTYDPEEKEKVVNPDDPWFKELDMVCKHVGR